MKKHKDALHITPSNDLNEKLVRAPCTKVGEHNLIAACNSLSCPHFSYLNSPKIIKSCGLLMTTLFI